MAGGPQQAEAGATGGRRVTFAPAVPTCPTSQRAGLEKCLLGWASLGRYPNGAPMRVKDAQGGISCLSKQEKSPVGPARTAPTLLCQEHTLLAHWCLVFSTGSEHCQECKEVWIPASVSLSLKWGLSSLQLSRWKHRGARNGVLSTTGINAPEQSWESYEDSTNQET